MLRASQNKHQEKSEATRRKLIKAALQVFARDGFEAARIEDIAAEAGFTRGAFYAHFPSKEDVFFALLEEMMQNSLAQLRSSLESCPDEAARLNAFRDHFIKRASDRAASILTLEFKLYAIRHPRIHAQLVRSYRNVRDKMKFEMLWEEMMCRPTDPDSADKLLLQAAMNGLVLQRAYDPASLSAGEMSNILGQLFDFVVPAK